jgi:hypothetical protein
MMLMDIMDLNIIFVAAPVGVKVGEYGMQGTQMTQIIADYGRRVSIFHGPETSPSHSPLHAATAPHKVGMAFIRPSRRSILLKPP